MSSNFVTDGHDKLYGDFVEKYREDTGRIVRVHLPGPRVKCPNCLWNPNDHKSAGVYRPTSPFPTDLGLSGPIPFSAGTCPVCNGTGQYTSTLVKEIKCHIRWLVPGEQTKTSMGIQEGWDCRLQASIKHMSDFRNAVKIEVDDQPMELIKMYPRGLKKLVQVLIFLTRSDFNRPSSKNNVTKGVPI